MSEEVTLDYKIILPDALRSVPGGLDSAVLNWADDSTDFLMRCGLTVDVAGSVVANALLRAAWIIAGSSKIEAGNGDPDIERFLGAARSSADSVTWKTPEARK